MVVHPSFPPETIPELIAYAKANPGKINMSGGLGTGPSLIAAKLFNLMARVDMVYVSYRGVASALGDLLGGHLQLVFSTLPAAIEYIRADKLRALAVTSAARSQTLREIPTVADFLPGYEASQWYGVAAPRNTPPAIVEKLNKEINAAVTDSKLEGRLADLGSVVFTGSPADFGQLIADETEKWAKVIGAANIKPE
jgi:tripartite-type tricarboxylate transporter receptor subunit TctC